MSDGWIMFAPALSAARYAAWEAVKEENRAAAQVSPGSVPASA
jgi:hypothetical protein